MANKLVLEVRINSAGHEQALTALVLRHLGKRAGFDEVELKFMKPGDESEVATRDWFGVRVGVTDDDDGLSLLESILGTPEGFRIEYLGALNEYSSLGSSPEADTLRRSFEMISRVALGEEAGDLDEMLEMFTEHAEGCVATALPEFDEEF